MIRFWICPKKRKIRFWIPKYGFGFSQKRHPQKAHGKSFAAEAYGTFAKNTQK